LKIRFAIISSIFLISFSQVFFFLGKDMLAKQQLSSDDPNYCDSQSDILDYTTWPETIMTLFRICMNGMNVGQRGRD